LSRPSLVPAVVVLDYPPPTLLFELLRIDEVPTGPPFAALYLISLPPFTLGRIIGG